MKYVFMSNENYHAHPAIGKSGLDLLSKSPAHFKYKERREPSRAMVIGSATHCAILEPGRFKSDYVIVPGIDDRRAAAWKQAVAARGTDEFVLTGQEGDRIAAMAESVRGNYEARELLDAHGVAEASFFAKDPVTGVQVKCRPDWLTGMQVLDLKTTSDISDDGIGKSCVNYTYFMQEAFYRDVIQWATTDTVESFDFLFVESDAPHCSTLVTLPTDAVEYGRTLYRRYLNLYAECLSRDYWPGVPAGRHMAMLPGWFLSIVESEMEVV